MVLQITGTGLPYMLRESPPPKKNQIIILLTSAAQFYCLKRVLDLVSRELPVISFTRVVNNTM